MLSPEQEAIRLYKDAYMRWCYELSHDKNHLTAKDIAIYVANEVLRYAKSHGFIALVEYYEEVIEILKSYNGK